MITLSRKQAQELLDLLEYFNQFSLPPHGIAIPGEIDDLMDALRAKLGEPEQTELAQQWRGAAYRALDTLIEIQAQPEGEWQGLTKAETKVLWSAAQKKPGTFSALLEAKLREKNNG